MKADIIAIIEQYYPKNISSFDPIYGTTQQNLALIELKREIDKRWTAFIERVTLKFGHEYVRDRSDNEPGNRCVIYCYTNNLLFEIVVHISRMVEYFFFLVKKNSVNVHLVQTKQIGVAINSAFEEVEEEMQFIIAAIKDVYNYNIMPEELAYTQLPFIATRNKTLGQSTVFNAVFADTEL